MGYFDGKLFCPVLRIVFVGFVGILLGCNSLSAQHEIKIYAGLLTDFPGIAYEYTFENRMSIQVGTAYFLRHTYTDNWNESNVKNKHATHHINIRLKKNYLQDNGMTLFWGGYFRYYRYRWDRLNVSRYTLEKLKEDNNNASYKSYTYKLSLGVLAGGKIPFGDKLSLNFTGGLGASPPFAFWEEEFRYFDDQSSIGKVGPDSWFGYVNHLSLIAELAIAYRF